MVRVALVSIVSFAAFCCGAGRAPGQEASKPPIVLSEKDFDRVLRVKAGDVIELRLPSRPPLTWVLEGSPPNLSPVPGQTKPPPTPNPASPVLGGMGSWVQRYEVSTDRAATLRPDWVYSRFGEIEKTKRRIRDGIIPAPPEFRPDLKPEDIREGMTFRITLEVLP